MDYLEVIKTFLDRKIQFVVAGGFALIAHGVVRVTMDLDLIIVMESKELTKAWDTLISLSFVPRQPVTKSQVTDVDMLREISKDKNMKALSFYHEKDNFVVVDLLVGKEFELTTKDIVQLKLFGMAVPVVSSEKLIVLKEKAGRAKDLEDIRALKKNKK